MEEQIEETLENLAGDEGFWKTGTREALKELIQGLVNKGLNVEDACETIEGAFSLGCAEYGG